MARVSEVVEQAAVSAREWERDRKAWNLPRQPVGTDSHASRRSGEPVGRDGSVARAVRKSPDASKDEGGAEVRLSA